MVGKVGRALWWKRISFEMVLAYSILGASQTATFLLSGSYRFWPPHLKEWTKAITPYMLYKFLLENLVMSIYILCGSSILRKIVFSSWNIWCTVSFRLKLMSGSSKISKVSYLCYLHFCLETASLLNTWEEAIEKQIRISMKCLWLIMFGFPSSQDRQMGWDWIGYQMGRQVGGEILCWHWFSSRGNLACIS